MVLQAIGEFRVQGSQGMYERIRFLSLSIGCSVLWLWLGSSGVGKSGSHVARLELNKTQSTTCRVTRGCGFEEVSRCGELLTRSGGFCMGMPLFVGS